MKPLRRIFKTKLFHLVNDIKINGPHEGLCGDCSDLYGDCSGLRGDCTGLCGDCSGLCGNLDLITKRPANIAEYIQENENEN